MLPDERVVQKRLESWRPRYRTISESYTQTRVTIALSSMLSAIFRYPQDANVVNWNIY